ncbi:MAG: hypothetical protein ABIQ12_04805 [Opitutaceae bacterium]
MIPHPSKPNRREIFRNRTVVFATSLALLIATGCSSGVAPSKTASGAGTGAVIGGVGGAVVGNNSGLGTGTGLAAGAVLGAITGGIVGMVQDAKDRKEQDRLSQERAYQQDLAKRKAEDARVKASLEEELAIAEGFRISDLELNDAKKQQESSADRLKKLKDEKAAALAKKKELDDAHEKTLANEAEIARLEEEITRLKGDDASRKIEPAGSKTDAVAKPGI